MDIELDRSDQIPIQQPVLAGALVAVVAAVSYLGVQVALGDGVDAVETVGFTVVFTAVYMLFAWVRYVRAK